MARSKPLDLTFMADIPLAPEDRYAPRTRLAILIGGIVASWALVFTLGTYFLT